MQLVIRNWLQTQCQDKEDEEDPESEDAEQDELLLETAGNIIPHLGKAMSSNEFVQCMTELMPIILEKLVSSKVFFFFQLIFRFSI